MKALKIISIVLSVVGFILFATGIPLGMFVGGPFGDVAMSMAISMTGFCLFAAGLVMSAIYQSRNRKAGRNYTGESKGGIGYPDLPPIPTSLSARKCPRCGEEVEPSDVYCPKCGYRLDGMADEDEKL